MKINKKTLSSDDIFQSLIQSLRDHQRKGAIIREATIKNSIEGETVRVVSISVQIAIEPQDLILKTKREK